MSLTEPHSVVIDEAGNRLHVAKGDLRDITVGGKNLSGGN